MTRCACGGTWSDKYCQGCGVLLCESVIAAGTCVLCGTELSRLELIAQEADEVAV